MTMTFRYVGYEQYVREGGQVMYEEGVNMRNHAGGGAGLALGYRYRLRRAFTCFAFGS
jgi:hypothetical protein